MARLTNDYFVSHDDAVRYILEKDMSKLKILQPTRDDTIEENENTNLSFFMADRQEPPLTKAKTQEKQ